MTTKLRARYDGKTLVPLEPVDLPTDHVFEVNLRESPERRYPSPQELVKMIESLPPIDPETWKEFDRALAEARTPARPGGVFDDLVDSD